MSVLDHETFFGGEDRFSSNELGYLEVANFETDVEAALTEHFGWKGKLAGGIGQALTPDNLRVNWGTFFLKGEMDIKDKKMPATNIWPAANKDTYITITFPKGDVFKFNEGGLWSDLVSENQIPHTFHDNSEGRGARPLVATDNRLEGTEAGFCMRAVGQISSLSSATKGVMIRIAIMLFPSNITDMTAMEQSKFAGWPGMKVAEVFAPLYPRPTETWGCPVLPFVQPTHEFQADDVMPASGRLKEAIFSIMRNVRIHDGLKCGLDVTTKWEQITRNPKVLMDKPPSISWPELRETATEETSGEYTI